MSGMDNLRAPWVPGESGNPEGYSKGRRTARKLRTALDVLLESDVPLELLEPLPDQVRDVLPDGVTYAELIALRVVLVGAMAPDVSQILAASNQILNAQLKPDQNAPPVQRLAPVLPSTEERRLDIARQLGLIKPKRDKKPRKRAKPRKKAARKSRAKPRKKAAKKRAARKKAAK